MAITVDSDDKDKRKLPMGNQRVDLKSRNQRITEHRITRSREHLEDSEMMSDDSESGSRPHSQCSSYSDSGKSCDNESYESDYESLEQSYSDSDSVSGESFENDYESPEENSYSQPLSDNISSSVTEEPKDEEVKEEAARYETKARESLFKSSYADLAKKSVDESEEKLTFTGPSRSKIRQRSSTLRESEGEATTLRIEPATALSQVDGAIRNERRRVQWANPELLNWSFHEGFADSDRKRRQLKRWNSSDDLVPSTGKRRGSRRDRESSRDSGRRQDYPLRDPPGHHIESPSIKTKLLPFNRVPNTSDRPSVALKIQLPAVVEDDSDKGDDMISEHEIYQNVAKNKDQNPLRSRRMSSDATAKNSSQNEARLTNMPKRSLSSDMAIPVHKKGAPVRRTQSSDGAVGAVVGRHVNALNGMCSSPSTNFPNRNSSSSQIASAANSVGGSSAGNSRNAPVSHKRAPATARRILACKQSEAIVERRLEWQPFEKSNIWVSSEKENPKLNTSHPTSLPKMPMAKRTPGRLSASLHYVGPRSGDVAVESSTFRSQSMHVQCVSSSNGLVAEKSFGRNKGEKNTSTEMDAGESVRSTEISSDSPSFALQISQSSLSSFQSEESSIITVHNNRPSTDSIMSSATLSINVSQARGLVSVERNMFGKMKPPEAFVELFLGGKICGKTGSARRSSEPIWKDGEIICEIGGDMANELSTKREKLELRVYDRNNKKENFIGAVILDLPKDDTKGWFSIVARSEHETDLYCAAATGSLEVKVRMTAKFYPLLTPEHVFVLRQHSKIALDLSWTSGSFLETSCIATDSEEGLVLWEESVYFANRTNPNRSIVFPERLKIPGHPIIDTLVLDLNNVPNKVGTLCLVLISRRNSFSDLESFEIRCKDAVSGQGIGRFVPRLKTLDTSVVLLRMSRAKCSKAWELEVMMKGFNGFREFGSMLPEIQQIARKIDAPPLRPAERTALMREGDSIRIQDYVASKPEKLVVGLFWKVANTEDVLPIALLLDKDLHLLDVIHRNNVRSEDLSVTYSEERFEVRLCETDADIHYICFSLGPFLGEQADHILTAAFNVLNTTDGTELIRSTIPDFDRFPTSTVTIGCFYRSFDRWDFAMLGISSSDSTIDECTRTLQNYLMENPLRPSSPLVVEA